MTLPEARERHVALGTLALGLLLVVLLSACKATGRVTIAIRPAGDGTVSVTVVLDPSAARALVDPAARFRLEDLRRAGWAVDGPTTRPDGSITVTAIRPFADRPGLSAILAQVSGPTGPFAGLLLEQQSSAFVARTRLTGTVDLRHGLDSFVDARLAPQLGTASLSSALAAYRAAGGEPPAVGLELAVHLPGSLRAPPGIKVEAGTAVWTLAIGSATAVDARSSQRQTRRQELAGLAALSLVLLFVVVVRRLVVARREPVA